MSQFTRQIRVSYNYYKIKKIYFLQCLETRRKISDRQCTYERNTQSRSRNNCCRGKAVCILSWVSVCLSVCSLSYPACTEHVPYYIVNRSLRAVPYLSTLSHKRHEFREKKWLNIKHVFTFYSQLLSETSCILRRIMRDIIISVNRSSSKVPAVLTRF